MRSILVAAALPLAAFAAEAQTLSPADILAKVEERVGVVDQYRQLLLDPDTARAMAAMEIMMGAGDPALKRMALEYGVNSPDPVVRRTALEAFFASGPTLGLTFAPGLEPGKSLLPRFLRTYEGSVAADGAGFALLTIGAHDKAAGCFKDRAGKDCVLLNADSGVSIRLWDQWWPFTLNDEGALAGAGHLSFNGVREDLTVSVPITP